MFKKLLTGYLKAFIEHGSYYLSKLFTTAKHLRRRETGETGEPTASGATVGSEKLFKSSSSFQRESLSENKSSLWKIRGVVVSLKGFVEGAAGYTSSACTCACLRAIVQTL